MSSRYTDKVLYIEGTPVGGLLLLVFLLFIFVLGVLVGVVVG